MTDAKVGVIRQTTKTNITSNERLQLIGLLVLGKRYERQMKEIEKAIQEITGEIEDGGHAMDAIWSDYDVDELLSKLDLQVQ